MPSCADLIAFLGALDCGGKLEEPPAIDGGAKDAPKDAPKKGDAPKGAKAGKAAK